MKNRLEDLWKSADDGASAPLGPVASRTQAEFEQLMDAWFLERRNSIEFEILLGQSRKIIARLLAEGDAPAGAGKKARRLLRAIEQTLRTARADES